MSQVQVQPASSPAPSSSSSIKFELLSDNNGIKRWNIEAIHVTTTRNNRVYPKEELELGARSLSFRPININHDEKRWLPFNAFNPTAANSNTTLQMSFDSSKQAVTGRLQISDPATNQHIEKGDYAKLSIEQVPTQGEVCSCKEKCTCEQKGVTFTGIALLETFNGIEPGDPQTVITKAEKIKTIEASIDQITNDVLTDMALRIQAQYDLVNALEQKVALDPANQSLTDQLREAKWSLFYMVMDYMKLQKGESREAQHKGDCPDGHHMVDGKCVPMEKKECACPMEKMFGKELAAELKRAEAFIKTGKL